MSEYALAIVIDADGQAAIGEFDATTGAVVRLHKASDLLNEATEKVGDKADAARKKWSGFADDISGKFTTSIKAGAVALAGMVGLAIRSADNVGKLAEKLGVSTEFISGMGYAADASGSSLATLTSGMQTLAGQVLKAAEGNKKSVDLFNALGIAVTDGHGRLKSLEQLLPEVADRFANMQDGLGKAAIANRLFGASGQELIPVLNEGSKGMAALREQAQKMGLVISGETSKAATELGDNVDRLKANLMGVATDIAKALLPTLVRLTSDTDSLVNLIEMLGTIAVTVYAGRLVKSGLDYASALWQIVAANRAAAVAEGTRAAASQTGLLASIKQVGVLQASMMGLQAWIIGWSVGTYLRDEFRVVADAGSYLVYGILQGWERIKYSTQLVAEYIKAGFVGAFNVARDNLANLLAIYANAAEKLDIFGLGEDAIAQLRKWEAALRPTSSALDNLTAAEARLKAAYDEAAGANEAMLEDMLDANAAHERAKASTDALADSTDKLPPTFGDAGDAAKTWAQQMDELADAIIINKDLVSELQLELAIEAAELEGNKERVAKLTHALNLWREAQAEEIAGLEGANEAREDYLTIMGEVTTYYEEEIRLAGLSTEARRVEEEVLRRVYDAKRRHIDLTPEQISAMRQEIAAHEATVAAIRQHSEYVETQRSIVTRGFDSMADAAAAYATGTIKSVGDLGKALVNSTKQMVAQMIAEFLRLRVIQPLLAGLFGGGGGGGWSAMLGGLFGGGGSTSASGGGFNLGGLLSMFGGGQGGFNYTSLFGAGQNGVGGLFGGTSGALNGSAAQSYGVLNTPTGTAPGLGMTGTVLAGLGGAYFGYNRTNGGAPGIAAAASYGALGIGVAGTAAGIAGGLGVGAAAGGAFSALGAAAAIPVVGWILAALAFIDLASGGKLFGTKFRPEEAQQSLQLSPEGGDAVTTIRDVRQRSLFRGRQWRTRTVASSDEAEDAADDLFKSIFDAMKNGAQQLAIDVPPMIEAAINVVQKYDKKGKPKGDPTISVDALGRSWTEKDMEHAQMRVMAEAILATVAASIQEAAGQVDPALTPEDIATMVGATYSPADIGDALAGVRASDRFAVLPDGGGGSGRTGTGTSTGSTAIMNEVHQIAERWRGDAELLLEGANFLLTAQTAIRKGYNLLGEGGTLTAITDLVEDLQQGEEKLTDTYVRLVTNTETLKQALELMGVELEQSGADLVRFATDIADAAGGTQQAQQLWQSFFQSFYTDAERAALQQQQLMDQFNSAAGDLGLSPDIRAAEFRAMFEATLPTLDPEDIVQWLQFSQALAQVEQQRLSVEQAEVQYAQWLQAMGAIIRQTSETDFQQAVRAARDRAAAAVADANALARARGLESASASDLALIHRMLANEIRRAVQQLEGVIADLGSQLGYDQLSQVEAEIARLEAMASGSGVVGALTDGVQDLFGAFRDGLISLDQYVEQLQFGQFAYLPEDQQVGAARALLEQTAAVARGGGPGALDALNRLQGLADQYLGLVQGSEASGEDFRSQSRWVAQLLSGIQNPFSAGGSTPAPVEMVPSQALIDLYAQRELLIAQQSAAERAALAGEYAARIAELLRVPGETFDAVIARLNVPLERLVADLTGVQLASAEVNGQTVERLAEVAQALGIELPELAASLGIDAGQVADANSALNDALQLLLGGLPAELSADLLPALADLENAASTEASAAALERMLGLMDLLPENFRLQLAPYFDAIDPIDNSIMSDLEYLSSVDANTARANQLLQSIYDEMRDNGGTITSAGAKSIEQDATIIELRSLRTEVTLLREQVRTSAEQQTRTTTDATERASDANQRGLATVATAIQSNSRTNWG